MAARTFELEKPPLKLSEYQMDSLIGLLYVGLIGGLIIGAVALVAG